jgi:YcxB-like protein
MVLKYSLSANDYLQHQLFIASKSPRIKAQRRKSWILMTVAFGALAYVFSENENKTMMYSFLAVAVISLCFYPFYLRSHYRKHYEKFIADTYKDRVNEMLTLEFTGTHIETVDKTGESRIHLSEIGGIVETGGYIYLQMQSGGSLIIPKLKIEAVDDLRMELKQLATRLSVEYLQELEWKWK